MTDEGREVRDAVPSVDADPLGVHAVVDPHEVARPGEELEDIARLVREVDRQVPVGPGAIDEEAPVRVREPAEEAPRCLLDEPTLNPRAR